MKRRLFLATLLACAAFAPALARGQQPPPQQQQEVPRISLEEFTRLRAEGKVFVLDVRYQIDRKIKGATHVRLDDLESHLAELPRDREIVTYCS